MIRICCNDTHCDLKLQSLLGNEIIDKPILKF